MRSKAITSFSNREPGPPIRLSSINIFPMASQFALK